RLPPVGQGHPRETGQGPFPPGARQRGGSLRGSGPPPGHDLQLLIPPSAGRPLPGARPASAPAGGLVIPPGVAQNDGQRPMPAAEFSGVKNSESAVLFDELSGRIPPGLHNDNN